MELWIKKEAIKVSLPRIFLQLQLSEYLATLKKFNNYVKLHIQYLGMWSWVMDKIFRFQSMKLWHTGLTNQIVFFNLVKWVTTLKVSLSYFFHSRNKAKPVCGWHSILGKIFGYITLFIGFCRYLSQQALDECWKLLLGYSA